jgi:hypothetical protein
LGFLLAASAACGDDDAMVVEDASTPRDGGAVADSGRRADGGARTDAGRDGGSASDSGTSVDAGSGDAAMTGDGGTSSGSGVGCSGACLFETSFTTAEGWTSDETQFGMGCGSGLGGIQTGVSNAGAWRTSAGSCDEVVSAANFPGGAGGRGFRHYRGDGTNNNGGGVNITLPSRVTEIWYSLRIRFSSGFEWSGGGNPNYTKDLYWHSGGFLIAGHQGGGFGFHVGGHDNYGGSVDWTSLYGGATADGTWHCLDYYHDIGSATARVWLDGALVFESTSVNYSGFVDFDYFALGENQAVVSGGDYSTDYDDLRFDTGLPPGSRLGCPRSGG